MITTYKLVLFRPIVMLLVLLTGDVFGEDQSNSGGNKSANPALERFKTSIVFYASLNKTVTASASFGELNPKSPGKSALPYSYVPGVYGEALINDLFELRYTLDDQFALSESGSALLWMSSYQWKREILPFFWALRIKDNSHFFLMGRHEGKADKHPEKLYANAAFVQGENVNTCFATMNNTVNWNDGEWHLLVLNWKKDLIEFSVDGEPFKEGKQQPKNTSIPGSNSIVIGTKYDSKNEMDPKGDKFLLDEVVILNVPLSDEDIKSLYEAGQNNK